MAGIVGWSAFRDAIRRLRPRRVPVTLQMSNVECGAACLAMVLGYYGRKTAVAECREVCAVGRDGVTAKTIAAAARGYGLRVKGFSLESGDLRYVRLPAIAHWNFDHFVLVERWSPSRVDIVDPAVGRRRLTAEEFDAGFTGVLLTMEPGVGFERRGGRPYPAWRSYLRSVWEVPGLPKVIAQMLGVSILLQALGLAVPLFTKVLVDHLLPFRMAGLLPMFGLGMVLVVLALMAASYLRAALVMYLQARLDSQLMLGFFEHVLRLPFRFFQQRTSGDLLMRLSSNMIIRETLTNQTVTAVLDGGLVLGYLALLFALDSHFGVVVLAIGAAHVALSLSTSRRIHHLMERELAASAESQTYLVQSLIGIATIKAAGVEDRALEHWSNLFFRHLNVSLQRTQLSALVDTGLVSLRSLSPLVLLWLGGLRVLEGTASLGSMLALTTLATSVLMPLASLLSAGRQLQLVGAHLNRIVDVVQAEPEQDLQQVRPAPPLAGRVETRRLSFRYDANGPWVLRDISITIEPGAKVALVGRSGSGKSTLAKVLLGLYIPTEGQILYDGRPLDLLDYRTLRSQCGVVLQEPFLFSGTIRENIGLNDPTLSLDQVMDAARRAEIHEEILGMPMRYETRIAEGGAGLSGGQRQRLAIARALAHRPAVLVLDEATSHLDVVTERGVDQHLSDLSCSRIVIAHRLSTIRDADLIMVLDGGTIVEQGCHDELLARGGVYATLVRNQLEAAGVPDAAPSVPPSPSTPAGRTARESTSRQLLSAR